jgi:microcystin-dependent protein
MSSSNAPIKFIATTIPAGLCFNNEQDRYNFFASNLRGFLPGVFSTFNYGSSEPAAEDRDKPWIKLNPDGTIDRVYVYNGAWVAPHPWAPDCGVVMMWEGTLQEIDSFDGGSTGTVTDTAGPMWSMVAEMAAKFPVGVGSFDSGAVVNPGDEGGEEQHQLTVAESAAHTHLCVNADTGNTGSLTSLTNTTSITGAGRNSSSSTEYTLEGTATVPNKGVTAPTGGDTAHNNLPPYRGIYFIRRTLRRFYTA